MISREQALRGRLEEVLPTIFPPLGPQRLPRNFGRRWTFPISFFVLDPAEGSSPFVVLNSP